MLCEGDEILFRLNKTKGKVVQTERFDLIIENPYIISKTPYKIKINNQVEILIKNIKNEYIRTIQGITEYIQCFLILCIGDNIKVEKVSAIDIFDRKIDIIFGYGKSNYENRSIFKNVVKYEDIKENFEKIIKNWIDLYEENELLVTNFTKLQTTEDSIINEYMNLMSAIDSLNLVITKKEQSKDSFVKIVEKLLRETNFILGFSEEEIENLAEKIKNIRRYFIHSNKTQKQIVNSNISGVILIINILIEVIRTRIMIEIGIEQSILEKYYKDIKELENVRYRIVNNINQDEEIISERITEGGKVMNPLSKKDKEDIAELNAMLGTKYKETEFDIENTEDLIKIIENITAEYMDYTNYYCRLEDIFENFDQSLEVFHPQKYFQMIKGEIQEEPIMETYFSIRDTADNMQKLFSEAEEKCGEIWKYMLLGDNKEVQKYFIGNITKYKKEKILQAIENTFENIYDIEYNNQVQKDTENFAKSLKEYLKK